ncbi:transposable element Tcb1 transposase [Trichonephila clavipes]|nr:transposable element Tcb1 transposase [Trichonephila clavipes]
MVVNDRTASSRQLAERWSTATGVLMSVSSIRRRLLHRGLRARVPLYRIPLSPNHRRLRLHRAHSLASQTHATSSLACLFARYVALVGWRLTRDPCPAGSKDEFLLRI